MTWKGSGEPGGRIVLSLVLAMRAFVPGVVEPQPRYTCTVWEVWASSEELESLVAALRAWIGDRTPVSFELGGADGVLSLSLPSRSSGVGPAKYRFQYAYALEHSATASLELIVDESCVAELADGLASMAASLASGLGNSA